MLFWYFVIVEKHSGKCSQWNDNSVERVGCTKHSLFPRWSLTTWKYLFLDECGYFRESLYETAHHSPSSSSLVSVLSPLIPPSSLLSSVQVWWVTRTTRTASLRTSKQLHWRKSTGRMLSCSFLLARSDASFSPTWEKNCRVTHVNPAQTKEITVSYSSHINS